MTTSDPTPEHPAHSGHEFGGGYARAAALAGGDPDWANATGGDPTPGKLDELLARLGKEEHALLESARDHTQMGRNLEATLCSEDAAKVREVIAALRAEQSARQASHGMVVDLTRQIHERDRWYAELTAERDALQARIDAALALHRESHNEFNRMDGWPSGHCNHDGDAWPCSTAAALTTESKEPAPKLDPEPWVCTHCDKRGAEEWMIDRENRRFLPRPSYSQNPTDYGIEAPHE